MDVRKTIFGSAALLKLAFLLGLTTSCQAIKAPTTHQEGSLIENLQSLRSKPDDASVARLFIMQRSSLAQTGSTRRFEAAMPNQPLIDSVVVIRNVASNDIRRISISQKSGISHARCLTVPEVSQALNLFIQPGEPTPVFRTEGQRKLAIARNETVEVRASAIAPNDDCLGEITFDYR